MRVFWLLPPWRTVNSRLLILAFSVLTVLIERPATAQQRAFAVRDDIAMARFSDPSENVDATENDSECFSPDGKQVAIVTTQGLIASDHTQSVIRVFQVGAIRRFLDSSATAAPKPHVIASISVISQGQQTIPYAPVVHDLRWSPDNTRIYFRAQDERGGYQLYEARADSGGVRVLTSEDQDVVRFDVAGDTIAYLSTTSDVPKRSAGVPINRDAVDATGLRSFEILFPGRVRSVEVKDLALFTLNRRHPDQAQRVPAYSVQDTSMFAYLMPFRLSPDGRRLLSVEPVVGRIPEFWDEFDPVPPFEHRLRADDANLTRSDYLLRPRRYTVTDLESGIQTTLVDAPNAEILGYTKVENLAAWSPDGRSALITNVFLPSSKSGKRHSKPCAVACVDVSALSVDCLYYEDAGTSWSAEPVTNVTFGNGTEQAEITLRGVAGQSTIAFSFDSRAWRFDPKLSRNPDDTMRWMAGHHGGVRVFMKQDLNERPTLWGSVVQRGRDQQLWDANPQLQSLEYGQASVFRWSDNSGRNWIGGLVKPLGYQEGRRYPLIIQMYVFRPHEFLTDGTDPTAFAARHLASAGFVVLQIQKQPNVLSDQDAQTSLAGYESAIRVLDRVGLIDPARVGVVGFSWTCWYAVNALIKGPKIFAAATIADGIDNSYMQYLFGAPSQPNLEAQMNQIRGGSPFGSGLARWVRDAPDFHLDQVRTPVRIEAIGPDSVLQEWELYASLYLQRKAVDLIYFPDGTHIHQRPLERLESQQGNVDWMRFWLQGYEDPDPHKSGQYVRWRRLRNEMDGAQERTANAH